MRTTATTLAAVAIAAGVVACRATDAGREWGRAQQLCADQDWNGALPLVKQRLLAKPDDAAAHYLYGRCYLGAEPFYPGLIEGEFKTALALLADASKQDAPPDDLELQSHLGLAAFYLRLFNVARAMKADPGVRAGIAARYREAIQHARTLSPDDPRVREFSQSEP